MTVRLGVLGAGRIGQVHAKAISHVRGAELLAISDPIEASAEVVSKEYGCDIRSIDQIENSDDVDAVVICTPTDTHADLIEKFCRAGKSVFCEKPIDLDIERVRACLRVVDETDSSLMVGFQRRYDPDFLALKNTIEAGRIGKVEMIALTSRDPAPPPLEYIARSGGIFRDMMVHDFDVARWLLDEEVDSIQAAASVLVDEKIGEAGDFDSANVILKTASGKQCTINNSRRAGYGYDQRIEVHGSLGAVSAKNFHETNIELADGSGYHKAPLQDFFMTRYATAYANEIEAFVQALEDGVEPPTTGQDGLMSLALAEAALLSVEQDRTVKMNEILG
ncbi:MAG: inositol 2-dehydrogenase [Pseudomonadota bacterium]